MTPGGGQAIAVALPRGRASPSVRQAIAAGEALIEAKKLVKRDKEPWLPWLRDNFDASKRTAQLYMQIARNREKAQALAHLGIEGVAKAIANRSARRSPEEIRRALEASQRNLDRTADEIGVPRGSIPDSSSMRAWRRQLAEPSKPPTTASIIRSIEKARPAFPAAAHGDLDEAIAALRRAQGKAAAGEPMGEGEE